MEVKQNKRPFWSLEYDYLKERDALIIQCEEVENLKQALDTGLNSIRLIVGDQEDWVGYLNEDGTYHLSSQYDAMWENGKRDGLECTECRFVQLDTDDDGYTIGIFEMVRSDDE